MGVVDYFAVWINQVDDGMEGDKTIPSVANCLFALLIRWHLLNTS